MVSDRRQSAPRELRGVHAQEAAQDELKQTTLCARNPAILLGWGLEMLTQRSQQRDALGLLLRPVPLVMALEGHQTNHWLCLSHAQGSVICLCLEG